MPSTSSKQTGSTLLAPVIINGKESTHSIKGKTVGSSGQQMDSNSDGLSMGMSLPAVMPEVRSLKLLLLTRDYFIINNFCRKSS